MFDFKKFPNGDFSKIIDICMCAIVITDYKYNIVYVNDYFTELSGYTFSEVKGKHPRLLQPEKNKNEYDIWDVISQEKEWSGEILNQDKDGQLYWEFVRIIPMRDIHNKLFFISIRQNITKVKELEEKLVRLYGKLEICSTSH